MQSSHAYPSWTVGCPPLFSCRGSLSLSISFFTLLFGTGVRSVMGLSSRQDLRLFALLSIAYPTWDHPHTFFGCPPCLRRGRPPRYSFPASRPASGGLCPHLFPPSFFRGREKCHLGHLFCIVWLSIHRLCDLRHDDEPCLHTSCVCSPLLHRTMLFVYSFFIIFLKVVSQSWLFQSLFPPGSIFVGLHASQMLLISRVLLGIYRIIRMFFRCDRDSGRLARDLIWSD